MKRTASRYPLLVVVAALSIAFLSATASAAEGEDLLESKILKVGTKAPIFTAQALGDQTFDLADYIGKKPVVMFFWSFFCGPCREEMPTTQKVCEEVGLDKVAFVGVNLDGKQLGKAISKFMADSNMKFTAVFDELNGVNYKIADPYGVAGTPTSYVIGLDGNVAFSAVGRVEPEDLKKVLDEVLAKKEM